MASYGISGNATNNNQDSNRETKVQISLFASKLKNVAGLGKGMSDPYAVLTLLAGGPHEKPQVLGKTEVIKNNLSPAWTHMFETSYNFGKEAKFNVGIFDEVRKSGKSKSMGSACFEIGEILGARGNIKAKALRNGGTIFARVTRRTSHSNTGTLSGQFRGVKLKNVDGLFSKSDPFFVISSHINDPAGRAWQPVYRSEPIMNNLNPMWKPFSISLEKLCAGNKDEPILVEVFDWEKSGKHQAMGTIQTSVNGLLFLVGGSDKKLTLLHKKKAFGAIQVDSATISGENSGSTMTAASMAAGAATNASSSGSPPKKFLKVSGITKINPEYKKWKDAQGSGGATKAAAPAPTPTPMTPPATAPQMTNSSYNVAPSAPLPPFGQALNNPPPSMASIPPPMAPPAFADSSYKSGSSKPRFVDYIAGGTEINLAVAVDYTGSNGDPRKPGTLHHIHHDGQLNDYEKALTAVGAIVARYDSDQMFPVLGFGAKYNGVIQHCFQVGKAPELAGISGMIEGYRGVFQTGLTMSGPTVFAGVIDFAAAQARAKQDANAAVGEQSYTILLILTDGAVTDVEQTKTAIRNASTAPLSIVIVGIGNADFSTMQFLDDFQQAEGGRTRDIVQFVEFGRHKHDRAALTRETLDEIPDQLVDYFYGRNIMPLPPTSGSKLNIEAESFNSEEDIDLAMSVGADGEINLSNPAQARWDAQSYGRASQFLPPAMAPTTAYAPSAGAYGAPQPNNAYGAPQPNAYGAPQPNNAYGAPQPNAYGAPPPQPNNAYGAPQPNAYGAPQPNAYGAPQPNAYGAPQPNAYAPPGRRGGY